MVSRWLLIFFFSVFFCLVFMGLPNKKPSKIVAIGSCVPAYIGHHMIRKAIEYSGGVSSLVHQGFFSSKWIGGGTSLFAESSLRPVTKDQLTKLMDTSQVDTQKLQATYRQLTMQQKKIKRHLVFCWIIRNS